MGISMSKFLASLSGTKNYSVLMVGLDAAGKTTILYKLKIGESVLTMPTIGFNVETVEYKNVKFTVWDVGGQDVIRPLWRHYFNYAQGLIFVVDTNDRARLKENAEVLHSLLKEELLKDTMLLVLANKQDLPHAVRVHELTQILGLPAISGHRKWYVQACCATKGEGLCEGLDWLADNMASSSWSSG